MKFDIDAPWKSEFAADPKPVECDGCGDDSVKLETVVKTNGKGGSDFQILFVEHLCASCVSERRECRGHESTNGHIGNVEYCDGSCRGA